LICGFCAWCEKKSVGMIQSKEFRGPLGGGGYGKEKYADSLYILGHVLFSQENDSGSFSKSW